MSQNRKKQLRNYIREIKSQYTQEQLSGWSSTLLAKLEVHPAFIHAKKILLYHSLPDEVQTHAFIEQWSYKKQILLTAITGDELELRLYTPGEALKKDIYGISEPTGKVETDYHSIELAIIPGMAFDKQGNRLGKRFPFCGERAFGSFQLPRRAACRAEISEKQYRYRYGTVLF